ncbi:MAG: hypothetical protein E7108_01755 [Bacteroidales bacterium]|nr:hypothetical protein [Bacteroidales bacterium]
MKRDSCVFYSSWLDAMEGWPDATIKDAIYAIVVYATRGESIEDSINPFARGIFRAAKPQIDANNQKYSNGKKGGRPAKTENSPLQNQTETKEKPNKNQMETKPKPNENENENENENVYVSLERESEREKILEKFFFRNFINAQSEVDRYLIWGDSTGWKKANGASITNKVAYASFWKPELEGKRFKISALRLLQLAYSYATEEGDKKAKTGILSIVDAKDDFGTLIFIWPNQATADKVSPYINRANDNSFKLKINQRFARLL